MINSLNYIDKHVSFFRLLMVLVLRIPTQFSHSILHDQLLNKANHNLNFYLPQYFFLAEWSLFLILGTLL